MTLRDDIELDPREIDRLVALLDPRRELVHRLAVRRVSASCRYDPAFAARTDALVKQFLGELSELLAEARQLARGLKQ